MEPPTYRQNGQQHSWLDYNGLDATPPSIQDSGVKETQIEILKMHIS